MRQLSLPLILAMSLCGQPKRPVEVFNTKDGSLRLIPIRHASLMLEAAGQIVHVDPWSQGHYDGLPQADVILITDIHGDHLDPAMIDKLKKSGTAILGPEAVAAKLAGVTVIRNGETKSVGKWSFEAIPMYNLKRGPAEGKFYHDKGRGNGYVVTYGGFRLYISGDTEGVPEMRALKSIDVALVSMNLPYTMPPEEAADAVRAFRPKVVYPYHYRGSDLASFVKGLAGTETEVRIRDWYY
jgi:L-ascorbate metabolism protein UlaG (beta-lactamase superfamily)